ncbi:sensor histidine kinase [Yaniella flava]|uniref:Sensor histidine kinase n=1 Tax=Yaniella flava TaxID=287930 RepID=A0ABN2UTB4_9MICC
MGIVNTPLQDPGAPVGPAVGATRRAMSIGQHVIAVVLTIIGMARGIDTTDAPIWLVIGVGVVYLAWHTAGIWIPKRTDSITPMRWWLIGLAVLWAGAVATTAEYIWLAFLLWLLAGHLLPGRGAVVFSVLVYALTAAAPLLHHGTTSYPNLIGPLIGGVFALGISRGYLELLRESDARQQLVEHLTRAQDETARLQDELALAQRHSGALAERTRISRDIHDTVAQGLSSIRLIAHAEQGRIADASTTKTLAHLESVATDALADVRRIIAALAPAELDDDGLATALQGMLERLSTTTGIRTELRADSALPALSPDAEVALLRAAQSALGNIREHSQATLAVMNLIDASDAIRLDIVDDGIGFDPASLDAGTERSATNSYGLRFMRTRLRELGGGLDIETAPGDGTRLSAYLPIRAASKETP